MSFFGIEGLAVSTLCLAASFTASPCRRSIGGGLGKYNGHRGDNVGLKELPEAEKPPVFRMESDGAHDWKAWRIHLADFASKVFR